MIRALQKHEPKNRGPMMSKAKPNHCEYHIVFNPAVQNWQVERDDGVMIGADSDKQIAIALAERAAKHDHQEGHDIHVCLQLPDGGFAVVWASR